MTIEEAIKILSGQEMYYDQNKQFAAQCKATRLAVKSLEAWNTIREIFKAKSTSEDWEYIHDLQIWEDALEIINKHLTELDTIIEADKEK